MQLEADREEVRSNSRLAVIRLATFTLRCMEIWRQRIGDYDSVMILIAIIAISAERLTRGPGLEPALRDVRTPMPNALLGPCNISSIAAATGLNRETARRKVIELEQAGFVARMADGRIRFSPDLANDPDTMELISRQIDAVARLGSALIRDGVLKPRDGQDETEAPSGKNRMLPVSPGGDACTTGGIMATRSMTDRRVRAVVATRETKLGCIELTLECGHVQRRRMAFCAPRRVICRECGGSEKT